MTTKKPAETPKEVALRLHFSSLVLKSTPMKQGKQLLLEVNIEHMLSLLGLKLQNVYLQDVSEVVIKIGEHLVKAEVQVQTHTVFSGLPLRIQNDG